MKSIRNEQVIESIEETLNSTLSDMKLYDEEEGLEAQYNMGREYIDENYAEMFAEEFGWSIAHLMCEELYERMEKELKEGKQNEDMGN